MSFNCAPGEHTFCYQRGKDLRPPGSGMVIARAKGVRREAESEGRRQRGRPVNQEDIYGKNALLHSDPPLTCDLSLCIIMKP